MTLDVPQTVAVCFLLNRRDKIFLFSLRAFRREVMLMPTLHDVLVAIVLAVNLVLEYIAKHKKR